MKDLTPLFYSETFAREIGMVNSRHQIYVSNATLYRRRAQKAAARSLLELFEMVNELGESFGLDELVDKSVSNPEIRRHELTYGSRVRSLSYGSRVRSLSYDAASALAMNDCNFIKQENNRVKFCLLPSP